MVSPPPCLSLTQSLCDSSLGDVTYRYDNSGNLTYQKDELSDRRTYFDYDFKGSFIGQKVHVNSVGNTNDCFLFSSANAYDEENRVIRKDMQGVHYALDTYYYYDDETDLISSVATTIGGSRRINYTYDDDDRVVTKSMTTITPYVNSYTYNDDGLIATDTVTAKNGTFVYTYTYDDNGNITEIKLGDTVQQRYVYDEANQLVREDNLDINKSVVYEYDNYGNILNKKEYAFTTGELGTATDTITYTYNDTGWKDQLTSYDGQSITYDVIGNPTSYRGITMTWNGRKLMSYTKGDDVITYKYDGNGLRTSKTVNGVKHDYYYDENNQLIYEIKEGVYELYYKYDADGNLFSITRYRYSDGAKHVYYAVTNTRGDVIELRSASGAIYATYTYDSWGKCISVKNSSGAACSVNTVAVQNSIRYRGYVYDYETGLYYLQSRYYDAEVGRFINCDDVNYIGITESEVSYNPFAYCKNNPVNDSDPNGNISAKDIIEVFQSAIDALIQVIKLIVSSYKKDLDKLQNSIKLLSKKQKKQVKNINSLIEQCNKIENKLGKVGKMLTAITVVISISDVYNKATTVPKVLVTFLIEELIELLIQGTSKIVARLSPQIPGVRYLTNAFLTIVVEKMLNMFFTDKLVNKITTNFTGLFNKISGTLNLKKVLQTGFKAIMA